MTTPEHAFTAKKGRREATGLTAYLLRPLNILRGYQRTDLGPDLIAGLTVAAVAVPQSMAYASIAELPAQYGLYTAILAVIVGALWGSSPYLSTGPTNANSLVVLSVLVAIATPGDPVFLLGASVMAFLSGIFLLVLAGLRLGAMATLASHPVLLGFTAGAGVLIAFGQLRHLLGLQYASTPAMYHMVAGLAEHAHETHWPTLLVGLGTLGAMVLLKRVSARAPAALVAITAAALVVWLLGLDHRGVRVIGDIPRSLPPLTWEATGMLPDLDLVRSLLVGSLAVAALGLVEAVAVAQSLARKEGQRLDSNQEFFGQGMANVTCGLLSGYPAAGSLTRSALNHLAGARTQLSGLFAGVTILAAMLALAPYASFIPSAGLAGIVLVVAWRMVDRKGIVHVFRTSRSETLIMAVTFVATLVVPLEFAVLAGVLVSLALFVVRASLPHVYQTVPDPTFRHMVEAVDKPTCRQLGIITIQGPLFFGAVYHVEEELRHHYEDHAGQINLVLRMHGVEMCDLTGVEMLKSTVNTYRRLGGDVFIIRPCRPVREIFEESGFLNLLGEDHILAEEGAIEYLFDNIIDPAVCGYECEHRVFAECQAVPKHPYDRRLTLPASHRPDPARTLEPQDFLEYIQRTNALLLDVREPSEFCAGHLPEAKLLPLRELIAEAHALPGDRPLAITCRSGRRSARALRMLQDLGCDTCRTLRGGILAWRAAGLPVTAEHDLEPDGRAPACAGTGRTTERGQRGQDAFQWMPDPEVSRGAGKGSSAP
jgi:SulP family sulfate permease